MLRDSVNDFKRIWDNHFPLVEFAYKNISHSYVSMAPYEEFYGR